MYTVASRENTTAWTTETNTPMARNGTGTRKGMTAKNASTTAWSALMLPSRRSASDAGRAMWLMISMGSISGASGSQKFWKLDVPAGQTTLTFTTSGGTGDVDLYVQAGSKPTTSSYSCRPYVNGNAETCTFNNPAAGTYWVMLNGYAAYSGVTLTGKYSATSGGGGSGDPQLTNGVPVTGISGATSSNQYWRITTPAGKTLTVLISGGTGDADLYTRQGSRPTTSTYSCRPYLTGNNEKCTITNTTAGDYYVMIRGYAAYSGVSLTASY